MEMSLGLKVHTPVTPKRTVIKTAVPYYHAVTLVAKFSPGAETAAAEQRAITTRGEPWTLKPFSHRLVVYIENH
jgi:hypothetical protein